MRATARRSCGSRSTTTRRCSRRSGPDGLAAARISRRTLYDYYAGYVPENEQGPLLALVDDEET